VTLPDGRVVVTGRAWMGRGIGAIESALRELFAEASDEIALTAYSISTSQDRIFALLENALARGVKITMVVNRAASQPRSVIHGLRRLAIQFPHLRPLDYQSPDPRADLHAKAVVVDRRIALVGSSNLSHRGWVSNHELAVIVKGNSARDVARAIDRMTRDRNCVAIA
jgi:cardiolipin synthase A/B